MTREPNRPMRATGALRPVGLLVGASALLIAGVTTTAAAFTDEAQLHLGTGSPGSGIGNPDRFDIAVRDTNFQLQDAATGADAVALPTDGATEFSESTPVVFNTRFENRDPGITGDLTIRLFDPDDGGNGELFPSLLFTVYLQGASVPSATGVSAEDFNAANIVQPDVAPGSGVDVRLEVVVAPGTGMATAGKSTSLGLRAEGESR